MHSDQSMQMTAATSGVNFGLMSNFSGGDNNLLNNPDTLQARGRNAALVASTSQDRIDQIRARNVDDIVGLQVTSSIA